MRKLAVLISGSGTNLQALINACELEGFPAEIVQVISNRPDVLGLGRAQKADIPTKVLDHKNYDSREAFDEALHDAISDSGADLICLAGFMRLLTEEFINKWPDKIINIHPSLLPAFKGAHAIRDAIDSGVKFSGCTMHYVRPAMDSGPIILQAAIPVYHDDNEQSLADKIHQAEHQLYPMAVELICSDMVTITDEKVIIDQAKELGGFLINPAV